MDLNILLLAILVTAVATVYVRYGMSTPVNPNQPTSNNRANSSNGPKSQPRVQPPITINPSKVSTAPSILNRINETAPVSVPSEPVPAQYVTPYQLLSDALYSNNTTQRKTELDKLVTEVLDIATGSDTEGWKAQPDAFNNTDIDVYSKRVADSAVPIVRASCTVNASPLFVVNCVTQFKHREKFEHQFAYGRVIQSLDSNTRIEYVEHVRQWPTQTRDLCLIQYTRILQANTTLDTYQNDVPIIIAYQSIQHPQAPDRPNYVRAHVYVYAWLLRPVKMNNNTYSTNVMFCCQIDPRGNLPQAILNKQSLQQACVCLNLIQYTQQFNTYQLQTQIPDIDNTTANSTSQPTTPKSNYSNDSNTQGNGYRNNNNNNASMYNNNIYMPSPTQSMTPSNRSYQTTPNNRSYSNDDTDDSSGVFNENEQQAMLQPIQSPVAIESNIKQQLIAYSDIVIKELLAAAASQHWEAHKTIKDVQISSRQTRDSPIHAFRGIGVIKCPPRVVFDAIRNPLFRYKYDNMLKTIRIVANVDEYTQIVYMHHEARRCILKTSRDFCFLARGREPDGPNQPYIHVGRSIDFVDCPVKDKLVRAELMSSGWIITPANAAGTWSNITYIVRVDVKGDIPSSLWNMVGKRQPLAIHYIRQQLEG